MKDASKTNSERSASELPPTFDPRRTEARILRLWKESGCFVASADDVGKAGRRSEAGGEPFVVVIPPPNVTAVLHMGHGLNNTIQDVVVRWRRMEGRTALWVPGTDHAGIATQNVVERRLARDGATRHDLGREAFVRQVWEHVDRTGGRILEQLERIGCSCDWSRARFTLEEDLSKAVREVFVRLYEDDLIYRDKYVINWCPRCLTALSNEEAESSESEGSLWHIRYPLAPGRERDAQAARAAGASGVDRLADGRWYLTISTTRPETMLGDTGVAVGPADPRYQSLIGATVDLPLSDRPIPVVADARASADFGTGALKVTPAHDPADFEIAGRAGLDVLNVMTERAVVNKNAPEAFRGMSRESAREAVLAALEADGLLAGRDRHLHAVPKCYRCDTVVEPRLSEQWFVRMKPLAEPALEAARAGAVTFVPERWTGVYEHWMENIRDWCISRQLWWGHRVPVWYCDGCGAVMALREDPDSCPECGGSGLEQDPDVLDTWFSSWLWPFSVFGWPEESDDLAAFYPGHALSTAPEILFFWVARMIMAGCYAMGEAPFPRVYLHGTVRDKHGRKMSKSLGNGIDPLEVVERYGADALRYTLVASAGVGADIRLDHEDLEAAFAPGRNFVNKLWNAGRFVLMKVGDEPVERLEETSGGFRLEDRWILSRLQVAVRRTGEELENFRIHGAAEVLRDFARGEFADWYLELAKDRLRAETAGEPEGSGDARAANRLGERDAGGGRETARSVLVHVLDAACRLLHPFVPFVTEDLWARLPERGQEDGPLAVARWPEVADGLSDADAETRFAWLQELVVQVRALRKEYGVAEGRTVVVHVTPASGGADGDGAGTAEGSLLPGTEAALVRLARVERVEGAKPAAGTPGAGAVLRDGTEVFLPLEGVIDVARERARLDKELARVRSGLAGARARLGNPGFAAKAPPEIVAREREKAAAWERRIETLAEKRAALGGS